MKNCKQVSVDSHTCGSGARAFVSTQGRVGICGQPFTKTFGCSLIKFPFKKLGIWKTLESQQSFLSFERMYVFPISKVLAVLWLLLIVWSGVNIAGPVFDLGSTIVEYWHQFH